VEDGNYDCYVLVNGRSPEVVQRFLDRFVPVREEMASEYEIPQYSERPDHVFQTASELLQYLAKHPEQHHAIYWRAIEQGIAEHAMVFPTKDGAIIFGLSCATEDLAVQALSEMKTFLASDVGSIGSRRQRHAQALSSFA
jgi:hypothetical protein